MEKHSEPKKKNNYWTDERLQEEANKYSSIAEMRRLASSAYVTAKTKKLVDIIFAKHENGGRTKKKNGFWTLESCASEAKRFKTRVDMRRGAAGAYDFALNNHIVDEIFKDHPNRGYNPNKKPDGFWTPETLKAAATNYSTRSEFSKRESGAYCAAFDQGIIDSIFEDHPNKGLAGVNLYKRAIYRIFNDNKEIYIGLSFNPVQRYAGHKSKPMRHLIDLLSNEHTFEIVSDFVVSLDARIEEKRLIAFYKAEGWTVLNKVAGGGLGNSRRSNPKYYKELANRIDAIMADNMSISNAGIARSLNSSGFSTENGCEWCSGTIINAKKKIQRMGIHS